MTEKVILAFVILLVATLIICLVIGEITAGAMPEPGQITTEPEPELELELKVATVYDVPMPAEHKQIVRECCEMFGISEQLVYGVIFAESNFNNDAVNEKTDCFGYMQLNPSIYEPAQFSSPEQNLRAGITELAWLLNVCGDATVALLCYNNGEIGAMRLINSGIYETDYTRKVLRYAEELKIKGRMYEEMKE